MTIKHESVNREELERDKAEVHASALRVYSAEERSLEYQQAWRAPLAVLEAFKAKYGTLRIGPYL